MANPCLTNLLKTVCLIINQPFLKKPIESMNGKPVFCNCPLKKRMLFEHYWMSFKCTPENEESVKDSIYSAKEEPESVWKHVNGMNDSNVTIRGYSMGFIIGV
ncbi:hypothetical protein TNCV_2263591 [Trichonephila clavipes]|nr:hypothetical protein TNCV_2263591 [Trichonephila clavipes]